MGALGVFWKAGEEKVDDESSLQTFLFSLGS